MLRTPADFWQEWVFACIAADIDVSAIRVGEALAVQPFPNTTLIVIDGREIAVGRLLVQKQRQRPRHGAVTQRSNSESACGKAPASKYARPRSKWPIQVSRRPVASVRILIASRGSPFFSAIITLDDLGVGLRLGLELGSEAFGQRPSPVDFARFDEDSRRQESDLHCLAVRQGAFGSNDGRVLLLPQRVEYGRARRTLRRLGRSPRTSHPQPRLARKSALRPRDGLHTAPGRRDRKPHRRRPARRSFPSCLVGFGRFEAPAPCPSWAKARASRPNTPGSFMAPASRFAVSKSPA